MSCAQGCGQQAVDPGGEPLHGAQGYQRWMRDGAGMDGIEVGAGVIVVSAHRAIQRGNPLECQC
jgi:hypothetical protein